MGRLFDLGKFGNGFGGVGGEKKGGGEREREREREGGGGREHSFQGFCFLQMNKENRGREEAF